MKHEHLPTAAQLRNYAAQLSTFPPQAAAYLGEFQGDLSDDFYLGLLMGLNAAITLSNETAPNGKNLAVLVPVLLSMTADLLLRREVLVRDARYSEKTN